MDPSSIRVLNSLLKRGIPFLLLSEETLNSRNRMMDVLYQNGLLVNNPTIIYTTAMAAVDTVNAVYPKQRSFGILGTKALKELVAEGNFEIDQDRVDWVLVGRSRFLTGEDYNRALGWLNHGAKLLSLSDCRQFERDGVSYLGEGAVVKMLEYASHTKALQCRYEDTLYFRRAISYTGLKKSQTIFVTGNLENGLNTAQIYGLSTVLITKNLDASVNLMELEVKPTMICEGLEGIL